MEQQPIKRSKHIQQLSRDHHDGLLLCWKIRQGLKKGIEPARIAWYVKFFWDTHLATHFEQEEKLMFSLLNDNQSTLAIEQHNTLRTIISSLDKSAIQAELLDQLADRLDEHIRFEERELFPHAEKVLSPRQLESIGRELDKTPACKDKYPDEFWAA